MPTIRSNEGISAEGMALLQSFRQYNYPGAEGIFNKSTGLLIDAIRKISATGDFKNRAELLPEVRDFVDHSTVDLIWIRDEYRIEIPDLDYSKISSKRRGPPIDGIRVSDICQVNDLELARLNALLLGAKIESTSSSRSRPNVKKSARKNANKSFLP